jgi:hypothetical protein
MMLKGPGEVSKPKIYTGHRKSGPLYPCFRSVDSENGALGGISETGANQSAIAAANQIKIAGKGYSWL